jgi:uncharacterized caspase-like protein
MVAAAAGVGERMPAVTRIALAFVSGLLALGGWSQSAAAQKRVALVIGNSAYQNTAKLDNPKNDAADMAATLKQLGFKVLEGRDLEKAAMDRLIRDFAESLSGAQIGLFFYAGHGIQVSGQNYLVPIDAKLTTGSALDFEMVRLDLVQRTMEREASTNIIMLDACRDNPLARNLARALGTRSAAIGKGLAAMESGEGTLISFSTQPGNVALDGSGRNSPFAAAMLKHITAPGEDLPTILINVRNDVMAATERRQVPWEHSALTAKVYFIPPKPAEPKPAEPGRDLQIELTFWASVKDSTDPAVLGTYLERYPNGEFAPIARALVAHYERQAKVTLAEREEARKREEETRKAAQVKRLEEEQRAREAAAAAERTRAKDANKTEAKKVEDQQRAELIARTEELQKAVEEARKAREDAKAAEAQKLAAVKAAQEATKAAEDAIAKKREAEKTGDPTKLAALPKVETPRSPGGPDANWIITWTAGVGCTRSGGTYNLPVTNGVVGGRALGGRVAASGAARWTMPAITDGAPVRYEGTLRGTSGSGTFARQDGRCSGTFTARRN